MTKWLIGLLGLVAVTASASYVRRVVKPLGDFAFVGMIHDAGGMPLPEGNSLEDQARMIDETVARESANWKKLVARFLRTAHPYQRTAALVKTPYDGANPNQLCAWLGVTGGELCFTTRVPVGTVLATRFAVGLRRFDATGPHTGLRSIVTAKRQLDLNVPETYDFDLAPDELEPAIAALRPNQFASPQMAVGPFVVRLVAARAASAADQPRLFAAAIEEAFSTYAGWQGPSARQYAATYLTLELRSVIFAVPDAQLVATTRTLLARLEKAPYASDGFVDASRIEFRELLADLARAKF